MCSDSVAFCLCPDSTGQILTDGKQKIIKVCLPEQNIPHPLFVIVCKNSPETQTTEETPPTVNTAVKCILFYNLPLIINARHNLDQQVLNGQPHISFQNSECYRQVTELRLWHGSRCVTAWAPVSTKSRISRGKKGCRCSGWG